MIDKIRKIGILGGTGALGSALTKKWAIAGYEILIGSRDPVKAQKIATQVNAELNVSNIQGLDSKTAARESDISVLTVPYSSHADTLNLVKEDLKGKILIDTTVPLQKMVTKVQLPAIGSAAMEAQRILGTEVEIVAALQNIGSHLLTQRILLKQKF